MSGKRVIVNGFECDTFMSYSNGSVDYRAIKYVGSEKDVVVPACIAALCATTFCSTVKIEKITFENMDALEFYIGLCDKGSLASVHTLQFRNLRKEPGESIVIDDRVTNAFPSLRHIAVDCAGKYIFKCTIGTIAIPVRIEIANARSAFLYTFGESHQYVADHYLIFHFTNCKFGTFNSVMRNVIIQRMLDDPFEYSEEEKGAIVKAVCANGTKYFQQMIKNQNWKMALGLLNEKSIKLKATTYESIIGAKDIPDELRATAQVKLREFYDVEKIIERRRNTEITDLINPERYHAMKQVWGWRNMPDETVRILAYKGKERTVEIPETIGGKQVTSIEGKAFFRADVDEVTIGPNVTFIGETAFANSAVKRIRILGNIQAIEKRTFESTPNLETVELPDSVLYIGPYAFARSGIKDLKMPSSLLAIGEYSFYYTPNLNSVHLDHVYLGDGAFMGAGIVDISLRNIGIVPASAFAYVKKTKTIRLYNVFGFKKDAFDSSCTVKDLYLAGIVRGLTGIPIVNASALENIYYSDMSADEAQSVANSFSGCNVKVKAL